MPGLADVCRERGGNYGPPHVHFPLTVRLFAAWRNAQKGPAWATLSTEERGVIEHAAYMTFDKLARLSWNPLHEDSWVDCDGYGMAARIGLEAIRSEELP